MKAMILAAGLGTRLRPLTLSTPKALLMVGGQPLIAYSLKLLQKYGVRDVVINLHYLGELIEKELGSGSRWGMKIHYSWETNILGTGGGIKRASPFFGKEPFFVINSDVLIDVNLKEMLKSNRKKKAIATMAIAPRDSDSPFTPIWIGRGQRIVRIGPDKGKEKAGSFTGVQIVTPTLLQYLPENQESCIIRNAYQQALAEGKKISAYWYDGYWNDLGTMDRYRQADSDLTQGKVKLSYL